MISYMKLGFLAAEDQKKTLRQCRTESGTHCAGPRAVLPPLEDPACEVGGVAGAKKPEPGALWRWEPT